MDISFIWRAGENVIVAEDAFAHLIGKKIPLAFGDTKGTGVLQKAVVTDDGRCVEITIAGVSESLGLDFITLDFSLLDVEY